MNKREIGKLGEEIAAKYLENQGIKIIIRNYFSEFGEIDLIGIENKTIIFIEVKLRNNNSFGEPIESIGCKKIEKIKKTACCFLIENEYKDLDIRFDVVSLTSFQNNYKILWLKNLYFS